MARRRIDWTDFEQDTVVRNTKEVLGVERITIPVQNPWKKGGPLLKAVRKAQLALPENRRRPIDNRDSLKGIAAKLIATGVLTEADFDLKPGEKKVDPRDARINQLADERDQALNEAVRLETEVKSRDATIRTLEAQLKAVPKERDVLVNFFADIMYAAQAKARAINKPDVEIKPPPPVGDMVERRHNSQPESSVTRRPRLAIVGGHGDNHNAIAKELSNHADLRFFTPDMKNRVGDALRQFKLPGYGKILVWTNYNSHACEEALRYQNIPFERFTGTINQMLEKAKAEIIKMRNSNG